MKKTYRCFILLLPCLSFITNVHPPNRVSIKGIVIDSSGTAMAFPTVMVLEPKHYVSQFLQGQRAFWSSEYNSEHDINNGAAVIAADKNVAKKLTDEMDLSKNSKGKHSPSRRTVK